MEMKFLPFTAPLSLTIIHTKRSADYVIISPETVSSSHFYSDNDLSELVMPLVLATL